jgi:hypothetical protein
MSKIIIDDNLFRLKTWVNQILDQSEKAQYLDTGDCLDLLNFAKKILKNVAKQQDLPLEETS